MYKVGDKVRVISVDSFDTFKGIEVGDEYEIVSTYSEGYVTVKKCNFVLYTNQIEKIVESEEMTFPEMAQKLIDGEFEVGTELVADGESFFVDKVWVNSFGLSKTEKSSIVIAELGASHINATWSVKQPIKEMSIEELQKELGYKIKIVEKEEQQ